MAENKPAVHFHRATLSVSAGDTFPIDRPILSTGDMQNIKVRIFNIVRTDENNINLGTYDTLNDKKLGDQLDEFQPKGDDKGLNFLVMLAWRDGDPPSLEEPFFAQHTLVLNVVD
jgi:hypothetical protein